MTNGSVSVPEAMAKARRMMGYPFYAFAIAGFVAGLYVCAIFNVTPIVFLLGLIAGMVVGGLYNRIALPKWCLWAFGNVDHAQALRKRAIKARYISEDTDIVKCIRRIKYLQPEELYPIELKLESPDPFEDNPIVPDEVGIYYSTSAVIPRIWITAVSVLVWLIIFAMGPARIKALNALPGTLVVATALAAVCLVYFIGYIRAAKDTSPQLIISNEGIYVAGKGQYDWANITNEAVVLRVRRQREFVCLVFFPDNEAIEVAINNYSISVDGLNYLLGIFRGRYKAARVGV